MANTDSTPVFENFDELPVYSRYEVAISEIETLNLVIEFDGAKARAALNVVDPASMLEVLETEVKTASGRNSQCNS